MTKEEFDALNITKLDLILIKHYDMGHKRLLESRICGINPRPYRTIDGSYGLKTYNCYRKHYQCIHIQDYVFLENIKSIEIIKKDFWK